MINTYALVKQYTGKDVVYVRVIQIVDRNGHVRVDGFREYPGMDARDAFMLYVMSSKIDVGKTDRIELIEDGQIIDRFTIVRGRHGE